MWKRLSFQKVDVTEVSPMENATIAKNTINFFKFPFKTYKSQEIFDRGVFHTTKWIQVKVKW